MIKYSIYNQKSNSYPTENVCNRLWAFERFPNKVLRGLDNAIIYTSNKEACLAACLNEVYPFDFHLNLQNIMSFLFSSLF